MRTDKKPITLSVLYEDNHIIVIEKPVNIPVQEDSSGDIDVLTMVKVYIKEKYNKPGDVFIGLVHRLDRPVGGVMIFARTSKAASRLSDQLRMNQIDKIYHAIVCNNANQRITGSAQLVDYLIKDSKTNTVTVTSKLNQNGKIAKLMYEVIEENTKEKLAKVKIALETGRSHQIRVQFSSRNLPLWGDQRYNKSAKPGQQIALWATQLRFTHPTTKEELVFQSTPPNSYPWNLFE